jgi:Phage-related minor tail protein
MAEAIGRADWELRADTTGLTKDLAAAEQKVKASGATVEKSALSTGTAFKAAGATAAVGFGMMAKGAIEMQAAQGKFQAATGASREEAVAFSKDMNGIVGTAATVGVSFEKIAATGTAVAQQFGTTGEATTQLTEDILGFAKVTGSDAEQAAFQLEDTLSAFGLTADDASMAMDKLVKSNQTFGTDAGPEALAVLQGMAPSLEAMGMGLDDGIELLNAFEVAGGNAADAQKGLKTAIDKLEPGQNLDDLIAKIAAIEDPMLKNQAAVEAFGKKAGPGLAKALEPGMTSLDDFGVSAEESEGAVSTAAENMLTDADKLKMFAERAGAALRGLGQDVGPLLSGLGGLAGVAAALPSTLTGPLVDGLKGVWSKVANNPAIKLAVQAAGAAATAAYSLGMKAAEAIHHGLELAWEGIQKLVEPIIKEAGLLAGEAYALAMEAGHKIIHGLELIWHEAISNPLVHKAIGLAGAAAAASYAGAMAGADALYAFATSGTIAGNTFGKALLAGAIVGIPLLAKEIGDKLFDGIQGVLGGKNTGGASWDLVGNGQGLTDAGTEAGNVAGTALLDAVVAKLGEKPGDEMVARFHAMGEEGGHSAAAGLGIGIQQSEQQIADDLRESVTFAGRTAMVDAENAFKAFGTKITKDLAAGINSSEATNTLFSQIDQLKDAIENHLSPREQALKLIGGDYIKTLVKGMQSEDETLVTASQDLAISSIATIEAAGLKGKKGQKGLKDIGILYDQLLASGMEVEQIRAGLRAAGVADYIIDQLTGKEQTDDARQGGGNVASAWVQGLIKELGSNATSNQISAAVRASMGQLHGQSPPKVGPLHHVDQWGENVAAAWVGGLADGLRAVPQLFSGALGSVAPSAFSGAGGGGVSVGSINVTVNGAGGEPGEIGDTVAARIRGVLDDVLAAASRGVHLRWQGEL